MGLFEQVLADMRERAAVARDAAKHNPDGTVHHEAVADMLEHLAARAEEAHKSEIEAKDRRLEAASADAEAADADIDKLKFDNMRLKSEQRTATECIIEQTNKVEEKDAEIEDLKKENASLRVIVSGATVADGNLREEIERLREIVKELADELETMICNEIVKSSKRHGK